jgi:hypothetical protein
LLRISAWAACSINASFLKAAAEERSSWRYTCIGWRDIQLCAGWSGGGERRRSTAWPHALHWLSLWILRPMDDLRTRAERVMTSGAAVRPAEQ